MGASEIKALAKSSTSSQMRSLAQPPLEVIEGPLKQPVDQNSLDARAEEVFGLDPNVDRTLLLPRPAGSLKGESGDVDWTDWVAPQIVADIAKSFLLPGHASGGFLRPGENFANPSAPAGDFSIEDAVKFTLDFALPAAQMKGKGAKISKRKTIQNAPTTQELAERGGALLEAAKKSGASIDPQDASVLIQGMSGKALAEGLDDKLHPTASAALNAITKRLGQGQSMQDLMIARRQLGVAAGSVIPDERRLATIMIDTLDDFVDNALPKQGAQASAGRAVWSQMRKSELIEGVIEKARIGASGFENGVRIGFRALLNNPKKLRGFSKQEQTLMRDIVKGTKTQNALRTLSKLSFGNGPGSNFLGGSIGVAGGAATMGPAGAAAAPIVGQMARGAAAKSIETQADLARALAAGGPTSVPVMRPPLAAGAIGGALMPQPPRPARRFRDDIT